MSDRFIWEWFVIMLPFFIYKWKATTACIKKIIGFAINLHCPWEDINQHCAALDCSGTKPLLKRGGYKGAQVHHHKSVLESYRSLHPGQPTLSRRPVVWKKWMFLSWWGVHLSFCKCNHHVSFDGLSDSLNSQQ